ncbi:hypothetical protein D8674_004339 [Pyrus ussuriensis x Pyrus communis]|uniref:Ubiquitin-like protease family profile domain-containing protein n=1 Tax=Pyrus ussuriensis x Pyrus communis TaxID=2448454 RepID=A0A5N5FYE4_9ROSA|nr:hypothetical protein D8674_004339 [Pyrus ussuriensis x Pyrus communis]
MTRRFASDLESTSKRFEAFEFSADDQVVETQSAKMMAKFRNFMKKVPRNAKKAKKKCLGSPLTQYTFLQYFAKEAKSPQKKISTVLLLDDDSGTSADRQCGSSDSFHAGTLAEDGAARRMSGSDACPLSSSSNHQSKQVFIISDDNDRFVKCSSSTLAVSPLENEVPLEEQASKPSSGGYARVEEATLNLHLKSRDSRGAGNANKDSGIEQLSCSVYEPHVDKEEDTKSLDESADKPFEVSYPEGDPDAVSISKRDLELLQPEKFINDTIVDFYIQYLKSKIQPEEKHRFHFFNSFFFRKLADLDKDQSSACEGKAAFQVVHKWTRKVNVFEKDYIFIPVNYSLHWSLIVICHPGEVVNIKDEKIESLSKVPCILHMDSIKGSHRGLENLVRRYLCEEWKERHGDTSEDDYSKFLHLRFVALKLPQQENSFDCGLFLLHYVECFLEEAPVNFSPLEITKSSKFLTKNWFRPEEASAKRSHIKKLICEILEDHSREALNADCTDKHPSSQGMDETDKLETGMKCPEDLSSLTKKVHGNSSSSNASGIEISLLGDSPPVQVASRVMSLMSPIEEVDDSDDQIADSPVNVEDCQQGTGLASKSLPKSCFEKRFRVARHMGGNVDASNSGLQNLSAVGMDENRSIMENEALNYPRKTDAPESSSENYKDYVVLDSQDEDDMQGDYKDCVVLDSPDEDDMQGDYKDCVVLDSQDEDEMQDDNEVKYFSSSLENEPSFHQDSDSIQNIDREGIQTRVSREDPESGSVDQQPRKRQRITRARRRRRLTPLLRGLHLFWSFW